MEVYPVKNYKHPLPGKGCWIRDCPLCKAHQKLLSMALARKYPYQEADA